MAATTQRGTVVNAGVDGKPLRPAITWMDQRATRTVPPIGLPWRSAFRLARVKGTVDYFRGEAEINWIRAHRLDVWHATHKFLLLSGYLNYRLCGRYADSSGSQVGCVPFDHRRRPWAARGDWKWQALAVEARMLPALVAPRAPGPGQRAGGAGNRDPAGPAAAGPPPRIKPAKPSAPAAARRRSGA